jgi:hypothetical protein
MGVQERRAEENMDKITEGWGKRNNEAFHHML